MPNIHHSTCSVIPDHILRHIAEHGDDDAREAIAQTQAHTLQIKRDRVATLMQPLARKSSKKKRIVYDAQHLRLLPGELVMDEGRRPSRDIEVREAFEGSGATYDFLAKIFGRKSLDGRGMPLISTVHYGNHYDNAMWNGNQMIYGDGDGKVFLCFTADIDVMGHEHTHGMTQHTAALEYHDQQGALNEHISDAFGMMIKQWWLAETSAQSDWLIGAGLFGPTIKGQAIRSMKAPGTAYDDPLLGRDPQPAHMRDYVRTADDDGGVHINSGILNRVFYLTATGLGGNSWDVAGELWYRVLTERLFPQAGFQDFANATVAVAGESFGSQVQSTVEDAFSEVGLPVRVTFTTGGGGTSTPVAAYRQLPAALDQHA
jgi:Zn-dependent metalloprotease